MENDNLRLELDALRRLLVERADHRLYFNVLRNDHKDGTPISIFGNVHDGAWDRDALEAESAQLTLSIHELDHISRQVFPLLRQVGETVDEVPEDYDGRLDGPLAAKAVLKWALGRTRNQTLVGPHPRVEGQTRQSTVATDHPYRVVATAIGLVLNGAKMAPPAATWLSSTDLAKHFGLQKRQGALDQRLKRWRFANGNGWLEIPDSDRRPRDPKYLYDPRAVQDVIDAMQAKR